MSIVTAETIILKLDARDKQDALKQLAQRIDKAGRLTDGGLESFMQALIKRESEFSTAVGYDYAIPHGKSDAVSAPAVAFARLTRPLLWDEEEEDWAKNLFMIAVPAASAGDEHMKILTRLATAIIDDDFREKIDRANDESEIISIINEFTQ